MYMYDISTFWYPIDSSRVGKSDPSHVHYKMESSYVTERKEYPAPVCFSGYITYVFSLVT